MAADRPLPPGPVRLYSDGCDPCVRHLHVQSFDQVGLLFKLCELLGSHGVDIVSADVSSEDGVVHHRFELCTARPSDFEDALDWCRELEDLLRRSHASGAPFEIGSSETLSKQLSVNPDLLSVVAFCEIGCGSNADQSDSGSAALRPPRELRYRLELSGINQAGLLIYASFVIFCCGFSVVSARISTIDGHVSDTFELSATSSEAQHRLRTHLDVPTDQSRRDTVSLPFHATTSDVDLMALMNGWSTTFGSLSPSPSKCESWCSAHSFGENSPGAGSKSGSDREGKAPRSRALSSQSDIEETSGASVAAAAPVASDGTIAKARDALGSAEPRPQKNDVRRMSVQFANGDAYVGNCLVCDGGEKRHGHGCYTYSTGTHETYRQYRGQWREDKKHGYGVLFYRNGGAYVGQWEANQKHGLGVLMDNAIMSDPACMPTFRYEGQWFEDEPHGLGVEENDMSAYFGQFVRSKRSGRGVSMRYSRTGLMGCEALNDGVRTPLLHALEADMVLQGRPASIRANSCTLETRGEASSDTSAATPHDDTWEPRVTSMDVTSGESLRGTPTSPPSATTTHESGNSGKTTTNSAGTRTPLSVRMQSVPSHCNAVSPDEMSQETPQVQFSEGRDRRFTAASSSTARPQAPQSSARALGLASVLAVSAGGICGEDCPTAGSGEGGETPWLAAPGARNCGAATSSALGRAREATSAQTRERRFEFSLCEENNLMSFSPDESVKTRATMLEVSSAIPEEQPGSASATSRSVRRVRRYISDPTEAVCTPLVDALHDAEIGGGVGATEASAAREAQALRQSSAAFGVGGKAASMKKAADVRQPPAQQRRPLRSPMLWSEDELAAFVLCLGLSPEISRKVRQRKVNGVRHFLEMSNSDIRRDFGLASPVERLTMRQSLRRLLEADRWENSIRGHKVSDVLSDSVLSKFSVPIEELTLVAHISQGGYGMVYRGVLSPSVSRGSLQAEKSHLVAVKEMRGEHRVRLYELLKEACVMASLNHPNICTFLGICADSTSGTPGKDYIISELMDCSLFDLVHQPHKLRWTGELTVSLVVLLAKGAVSGIVYLHGKNLVHADLKSSNILIDYSSSWQLVPRICDFGHAAVRTFPAPHHRCGTPHWAAPEVLRREALSTAADVYSMGVITWEMLTQKLPHKGLSFGQVLASVGWAGWKPDLSLLPNVPRRLRRLITECLSFTPGERPSSKDMQRSLRMMPKQARLKALQTLASFVGLV